MRTELPDTLPADKRQLVAEFKQAMEALYGERLFQVILYGSYARGDWHAESDIDFLVVLKDEKTSKKSDETSRIIDATFDLDLKFGVFVSTLPMGHQKFENAVSPLLFFVRKEGIEL